LLSAFYVGVVSRVKYPLYDYAVPVKFYEYVATGLPLIMTANRGSELVKIMLENKLGLLCEPNDIKCLEKTLTRLVRNERLLRGLRGNSISFRELIDGKIGAEVLFRAMSVY